MPAKGKHRRPKSQRITRTFAVAGTGGAALALPLLGATGANAAPAAAPKTVPAQSTQSAPVQAERSAPAAATQGASAGTYAVKSGDCLAAIADGQGVDGGWEQLYENNRSVVGDNPDRILPGMQLNLDGEVKAPTADTTASEAESQPETAQQSADSADSGDSADEAAADSGSETASAGGFQAPVDATISTQYGSSGSMWSSGAHTGTDFAVGEGTSVKAIGAGTVVSAGWGGAYGNEVVIQHEDGHYSQYGHLSSLGVSAGQSVSGGDEIGLSGTTGNSTGPHLHFEVRTGPDYGSDIDPLQYLRSQGVSI